MANKALAFFDRGLAVEMATPIFSPPRPRRRGRKNERERFFPNGMPVPTRDQLIQYILEHVLYQIDLTVGGPVFCKHIIKQNQDRNRESMYHIVFGPPPWTGVWEVIGNRRMFDVRTVYLEQEETWLPQIVLSPGNYIGVDNLNGIELPFHELRAEMIRRGFTTAEEFDRFSDTTAEGRRRAMRSAVRGIWM